MQTNFIQPNGNTSIQSSAEVLSQLLNIPQSTIGSIERGVDLTNLSFAVDPVTKEIYNVTGVLGSVTGMVASGTTAVVSTENGSFPVNALPAQLITVSFPSITDLKNFNPWFDKQILKLISYNLNGTVGGGEFYYDANDTSTADDGMFTIVTSSGKRLKRLNSDKVLKVEWAGVEPGGDISAAWQKAIDYAAAVATKSGNFYQCPSVELPGGKYTLTKGVVSPPFVRTIVNGSIYIDCKALNDTHIAAFWIKGFKGSYQQQGIGGYTLSSNGGGIYFEGPGRSTVSSLVGIKIGNTATENSGNGFTNCPPKITGVTVRQFRAGLQITEYDAYLISVEYCDFGNSGSAVQIGTGSRTSPWNAGERIAFTHCTFYGGGEYGFIEAIVAGFNIDFTNVSFDYTATHVFNFGSNANGNNFRVTNSHTEAVGGYIVNDVAGLNDSYVTFINSDFMMTLASGSQVGNDSNGNAVSNAISRPLFNNQSVNIYLDISGPSAATQTPYDYYIFLCTPASRGVSVGKSITPYANPRPSKISSLLSKGWNFGNETDGTAVTQGKVLTDWTFRLVSGGTAAVATLNANGDKCVTLTPTNNTSNMYAYWSNNELIEVSQLESYSTTFAVQYGSADTALTAGNQLSSNIRYTWYDNTQTQISTETYSYDLYSIIKDTAAPNAASATTRIVPIIPTSRVAPPRAKFLRIEYGIVRVNYPLKLCYNFIYKGNNVTATV